MQNSTSAIVIQSIKHTNSSLIVKLLTKKYGVRTYFVRSTKSKKGSGINYFQPLSLIDVAVSERENKSLQNLSKVEYNHVCRSIPFSIEKTSIAFFLAEILGKVLEEQNEDVGLFEFVSHSIKDLDEQEDCSSFHLFFLTELTRYLGFFPQNVDEELAGYFDTLNGLFTNLQPNNEFYIKLDEKRLLQQLFSNTKVNLNNEQRKELLSQLLDYYSLHHFNLKNLKSFDVLKELFS